MDVKCPSILATDIHPCQDSANDQLSNCCSSSNVTLAVWRIWYFSDAALSDIDSDDEWGSARCGIIYQAMLPTPGTPLPESGDHWASALQYTALPIAHCTHSLLIAHHTQSTVNCTLHTKDTSARNWGPLQRQCTLIATEFYCTFWGDFFLRIPGLGTLPYIDLHITFDALIHSLNIKHHNTHRWTFGHRGRTHKTETNRTSRSSDKNILRSYVIDHRSYFYNCICILLAGQHLYDGEWMNH